MNNKYIIGILILIIITSILGYYYKFNDDNIIEENFDNFSNYILKKDIDKIYNTFYSNIYDQLFHSSTKNHFEIYNINNYTISDKKDFTKDDIKFLDLGCGTGYHLDILKKYKLNAVGIDNSIKMLEKGRKMFPTIELIKGDFHKKSNFKNREFTHITCFFFSFYYSNYQEDLFKNINYWLKPKGFFCVHLVNKDNFDPILERSSSLIPLFNPQKDSETRQTQTKLKFNKFNYIANWQFKEKETIFEENILFKDNSNHIKNKHKLYIQDIKYYVKLAKKNGFTLHKIIDLTPVNHDDNFIYIFQKKYGE